MGLGVPEIVLIILGVVLLFGGKKIPELMRGLGSGVKEFKKATDMDDDRDPPRRGYDRQIDDRYRDDRRDERVLDDRGRDDRYRDDRHRDDRYRDDRATADARSSETRL